MERRGSETRPCELRLGTKRQFLPDKDTYLLIERHGLLLGLWIAVGVALALASWLGWGQADADVMMMRAAWRLAWPLVRL